MKILLAAPASADLSVVRNVLAHLDVQHWSIGTTSGWTDDLANGELDGVLAFLPAGAGDDLVVMFAIGVAVGQSAPLLVFSDSDLKAERLVPSAALVRTRSPLSNRAALELHLSIWFRRLGAAGPPVAPTAPVLVKPSLLADVRGVLAHGSLGPARTQDLETLVRLVFQSSGGVAVEPEAKSARGFDFVADLPGAEALGGPLFVEVKSSRGEARIRNRAIELAHTVDREGPGVGLLVFDDSVSKRRSPMRIRGVLVFGLGDLADRLTSAPLAQLLVEEHSRLADHGA